MKAISLRLEGFTSFRQLTEVDFKELDIFAIVGPTGAGKTSLIDAITYALYGCTARVGEKNVSDLIHLGSQQASVLFEFRSGDKSYRIVRSMKKTKKSVISQRQLEYMAGPEVWEPLASSDRALREKIKGIIGLDFQGFIRSVVLPQGQFDQLLKGDVGERRRILSDLLQLNIYDQMGRLARSRGKEATTRIEMLERQLKTEFSDATQDHQLELQKTLSCLRKDVDKNKHLLKGLTAIQTVLAKIESRELQILQLKDQQAQLQIRNLTNKNKQKKIEAKLKEIEDTSEQVATLKKEILYDDRLYIRLTEMRPLSQRLNSILVSLENLTSKLENASRKREMALLPHQTLLDKKDSLAEELSIIQLRLGEVTKQLEHHETDHPPLEILRRLRQNALQIEVFTSEGLKSQASHRRIEKELVTISGKTKDLESQLPLVKKAHREIESQIKKVGRARSIAKIQSTLKPGGQCPVCDQPITGLPETSPNINQNVLDQEILASQSVADVEKNLEESRVELAVKKKELQLVLMSEKAMDSQILSIRKSWPQGIRGSKEPNPRIFFDSLIKEKVALKEIISDIRDKKMILVEKAQKTRSNLKETEEKASLFLKDKKIAEFQIQELVLERSTLKANLGEWADRKHLQKTYSQLHEARKSLKEYETKEINLTIQIAQLNQTVKDLRQDATEIKKNNHPINERLEFYSSKSLILNNNIDIILSEFNLRPSIKNPNNLSKEIELQETEFTHLVSETGRIEEKLTRIKIAIKRAKAIRIECKKLKKSHSVAHQLGLDLRSSELLSFIQEEALARLAQDGSRHFQKFSAGRYRFVISSGDSFAVIDDWNAREIRSAATLSGGESFLASLALAVALSESLTHFCTDPYQLQLESLFLDEGFSTLDPETLELVLSGVESLAQQGRQIGVVSHIPALAQRLPHQIQVNKAINGSTLEIH